MKMVLKLHFGDSIDRNIDEEWDRTLAWPEFIKSLDQNITKVYFDLVDYSTTIHFNSEAHYTWFIMRYS